MLLITIICLFSLSSLALIGYGTLICSTCVDVNCCTKQPIKCVFNVVVLKHFNRFIEIMLRSLMPILIAVLLPNAKKFRVAFSVYFIFLSFAFAEC